MRYRILAMILIAAAAGIVGCSSASNTSTPSTGTTSSASSGAATTSAIAEVGPVLDITIAGGQVTPAKAALQARVGQPITFRVTSDAADELHVHSTPGHEFEIAAAPNQTFTFTMTHRAHSMSNCITLSVPSPPSTSPADHGNADAPR